MNKNDLVANVASSAGLSKADAAKACAAVFDSITASLKGGNEVRLVGFGTFAVTRRRASTGPAHEGLTSKRSPWRRGATRSGRR